MVNAHIWPYHNRENLDLMKLEEADIDKPKNILRLHKTIEDNFDHLNFFLKIQVETIHNCCSKS